VGEQLALFGDPSPVPPTVIASDAPPANDPPDLVPVPDVVPSALDVLRGDALSTILHAHAAARYFPQFAAEPPFRYTPKASPAERDAGCEGLATGFSDPVARHRARRMETPDGGAPLRPDGTPSARRVNTHPCVKPVAFLRWLVRLVSPPGAVICDLFAGSGSTVVAAIEEGVRIIAVELDAEGEGYIATGRARAAHAERRSKAAP